MSPAIDPQTHIFIIGQAPQREPYTSLFRLLEQYVGKGIKVSWVNALKKDGESFLNEGVTKQPIASMLVDDELHFEPAIDFDLLTSDETHVSNLPDLIFQRQNTINPIIIQLPYNSFRFPYWVRTEYSAGTYYPTFKLPNRDETGIEILGIDAPVIRLIDSEFTLKFLAELNNKLEELSSSRKGKHTESSIREMLRYGKAKLPISFTQNVQECATLDRLQSFITTYILKGLEKQASTGVELTGAEEAKLTILAAQREAVEASLVELRSERTSLRKETAALRVEKATEIRSAEEKLAAIELEMSELLQTKTREANAQAEEIIAQATTQSQKTIEDANIEAERIKQEAERVRESADLRAQYLADDIKRFKTDFDRVVEIRHQSIQKLSDALDVHFALQKRNRFIRHWIKSTTDGWTSLEDIIKGEVNGTYYRDSLNAIRQNPNSETNLYEAAHLAVVHFALKEAIYKETEKDPFKHSRISDVLVWTLLADAYAGATEAEKHWFLSLDFLSNEIRRDFIMAMAHTMLPETPDGKISLQSILDLIKNSSEIKTPAQEVEAATLDKQVKAALPIANGGELTSKSSAIDAGSIVTGQALEQGT